jgi:hypothetical protein
MKPPDRQVKSRDRLGHVRQDNEGEASGFLTGMLMRLHRELPKLGEDRARISSQFQAKAAFAAEVVNLKVRLDYT